MNESSIVRQISWRDVFPWLLLLRVFRVAISPWPLLLCTLAVILCSGCWWFLGAALLTKKEFATEPKPVLLTLPHQVRDGALLQIPPTVAEWMPAGSATAAFPYWDLTEPVRRLFDSRTSFRRAFYYLSGSLVALVIWSFVGGVISRQALLELGCEQTGDWFQSIRFVAVRYLQYLMAPLAPLLALVFLGLLIVPLGWLMTLSIGVFLAGLVWIFVVALGLIAAWLIVGLVFGWPLMFGAIGSKKDGDALQAFSDSFSYVYGKPLHYLFYVIVALTIGGLTLYIIELFGTAAVEFGFWATSWGAGGARIAEIRNQITAMSNGQNLEILTVDGLRIPIPISQWAGIWLLSGVLVFVEVIKIAAAYSYFFVASTAIFLLMRLAVDEKEMDEIHLEEEDDHVETARRAMLSDEAPAAATGPKTASSAPSPSASTPSPPPPEATVAYDTATPEAPPPPIVSTEISTPPADSSPAEDKLVVKPDDKPEDKAPNGGGETS